MLNAKCAAKPNKRNTLNKSKILEDDKHSLVFYVYSGVGLIKSRLAGLLCGIYWYVLKISWNDQHQTPTSISRIT